MSAIHLQGNWVREYERIGRNGNELSLYSSLRTFKFLKLNNLELFLQVNSNKKVTVLNEWNYHYTGKWVHLGEINIKSN